MARRVPLARGNEARVGVIFYDWRKAYVVVFFYGPNGSVAGFGPKALDLERGGVRVHVNHTLRIPLPQWTWARAYKHRRIPGSLKLHNLNQRLYRWLDKEV